MADFDIQAAKQAGYSDSEIGQFLLSTPQAKAAQQAGYSDSEILQHFGLGAQAPAPVQSTAPATTAPAGSSLSGPGRELAIAGSNLLSGAESAIGLPGDIEHAIAAGVNRLAPRFASAFGQTVSTLPGPVGAISRAASALPTTLQVQAPTNALGLTNVPALAPATPGESQLAAVSRGVGGALPFLPFGGASAIAPTVLSGAGAGEASELARESGAGTWAQIAAGLGGGLATGGAASLAQRGINALTGDLTPTGETFAQAGIPMRSAAYTSESPGIRSVLRPAAPAEQTRQDLGDAIEATAKAQDPANAPASGVRTLEQAGQIAQGDAREWLNTTMPAKLADAWKPVDDAIAPTTSTPIRGFTKALQSINVSAGKLQDLVDAMRPKLPKQLQNIVSDTLESGAKTKGIPAEISSAPSWIPKGQTPEQFLPPGSPFLPKITKAAVPGKPITWGEVQQLRSTLGDAMVDPKIIQDIGPKNMERLYAALTGDMRGAATGVDQLNFAKTGIATTATRDAFDSANAESSKLYNFAENTLSRIIDSPTKNTIKPEDAAKALISGGRKGGTDLAALRQHLPQTADALGALTIRQAGLDTPDTLDSTVHGNFPRRWATISPEAKAALIPNPASRARLDAASQVAGLVGKATPESGARKSLAEAAGVITGHFLGGALGLPEPVGTLGGALAPIAGYYGRNALANSSLLARIVAGVRPEYAVPLQLPIVAGVGATGS